jgi:hypothetical protein
MFSLKGESSSAAARRGAHRDPAADLLRGHVPGELLHGPRRSARLLEDDDAVLHRGQQQLRAGHRGGRRRLRHQLGRGLRGGHRPAGRGAGADRPGQRRVLEPEGNLLRPRRHRLRLGPRSLPRVFPARRRRSTTPSRTRPTRARGTTRSLSSAAFATRSATCCRRSSRGSWGSRETDLGRTVVFRVDDDGRLAAFRRLRDASASSSSRCAGTSRSFPTS